VEFDVIGAEDLSLGWGDKWPAPAKLNLMLKIVGRRADGYHLLQTVFQMLDFCDWISFSPAGNGVIRLKKTTPGVEEQNDLTIKAAQLLAEYTGCKSGVCIDIEKNLPMGGGLGGGSSDAATTLVVLNRLWQLGLSKQELMELGLQLGADVPVFVYGYSAWGEGVGEQLQSLTLPEKWVVIIKPECHVNTKEIFCAEGLTRDSKPIRIEDFIAGNDCNDCTEVVSELYQPVRLALEALSLYSKPRLTGTGACVFALFDLFEDAQKAFQSLSGTHKVYLSKCTNKSPLYTKLEQS
jgi:4-diphosphocytidyl-2-C-methyl-D-erythritol kinase